VCETIYLVRKLGLVGCGRSLAWSRTGTAEDIRRRKPATLLIARKEGREDARVQIPAAAPYSTAVLLHIPRLLSTNAAGKTFRITVCKHSFRFLPAPRLSRETVELLFSVRLVAARQQMKNVSGRRCGDVKCPIELNDHIHVDSCNRWVNYSSPSSGRDDGAG